MQGREKAKEGGGSRAVSDYQRRRVRPPLSLAGLERGTLGERAADAIRRRVLVGDVRPGQRLEPMRELADELEVSVPVVREAVARLVGEGFIEVRAGVGTFVARRMHAARSAKAVRRRASRSEAAELRRALDPAVAGAAAHRASNRDMEDLHRAVYERRFAAQGGDMQAFVRADVALHLAVSRASRNGLGIGMSRMAATVLRSELAARAWAHATNRELGELHRQLVGAILDGKRRRAATAARAIARIETLPP